MIRVIVQPFRLIGFEIQWVGADQQSGRRPPLHGKRRAHVMKRSLAGAKFVARIVRLHMLRHVIQLNMPARHRHFRLAVVLNVIRVQPRVFVNHVHVSIAVINFSRPALRVRGKRGFAAAFRGHEL